MKNVLKDQKSLMVAALLAILIITAAWQRDDTIKPDSSSKYKTSGDTAVPKQRNYDKDEFTMKDLDRTLSQLNIEIKKLSEEMKNMHFELSKNLKEELGKIDMEKINTEVEASMKNIDFEKLEKEISQSLKEARAQVEKIDKQKIRSELESLQKEINSGKLKKQIEESLKDAELHMKGAGKEWQDLKNFTNQLEKDGLINKEKGFTIEWKNGGELYINGTKQPKDISEKYKRFYKGGKYKIKINPEKGEYI